MGEQHLQGDNRLEETGYFRRPQVNPNFDIETGMWATEAENCNLYSGELRPLHKPALAYHFCRPGDPCWHVPIPDDPSVPPEPPVEPPNCVPVAIYYAPLVIDPPIVIYDTGPPMFGYGQDRYIAVGSTTNDLLINPDGHGELQYSDDGGATWIPINWSQNSSLRICQDMIKIEGQWYVQGYRADNRADRTWRGNLGVPDGVWVFTNNQDLSYNHGTYYQDKDTYWRWDGNNNGPGVLRKYADQTTGTPVTFTSAVLPIGGQHNGWNHRRVGNDLFIATVYQTGHNGYMVWDISDDVPVFVGAYDDSTNQNYNMESSGSTIICTATAAEGGTLNNSAIIQSLARDGTVSDTFMDFETPVDLVACHYENGSFIITAAVVSDNTKLRYGFGTSGSYAHEIDLPYPMSTSDRLREVRYLGNGVYAIGYLAVKGGQDNTLIVMTHTLPR